jgi:prophage tail gpP-like protein
MALIEIIVGGERLEAWTEMTLQRSKDELTGSLSVTLFAGALPPLPMLRQVVAGADILVYVANNLAFTGNVDSRSGTGAKKGHTGTSGNKETHGDSMSVSVGPNEYSIKMSARGKTRRLIDSSHQHRTTNMMQPTTKEVVEKLVEPWKTEVDWKGEEIKLDKMRFRDGGRVVDELHRVGLENSYFMYETREGKLRVTDGVGSEEPGDPIILGQNILSFTVEQSETEAKSEVKVKGQRTHKKYWGKNALLKTHKTIKNKSVKGHVPLTIQHYGDGDEKTLERRARFEANKRNAMSKKVTVEVFHVQSPSGAPWDIGTVHYVEIPPEGVFDMFEVTELTYTVNADKELKTSMTLAPPPSGGAQGAKGGHGLSKIKKNTGHARRSQAGFTPEADAYPQDWDSADLSEETLSDAVSGDELTADGLKAKRPAPPLTLPSWFRR